MAEETKVEETKPEEAEDEKSEPAADAPKDEPEAEKPAEKSEDEKPAEEDAESEAEAVEPAEEMGAMDKVGAPQPPAITDTLYVPPAKAKDGTTNLNPGTQYLRADHFGRAAILHSDRANGGTLPARPTYADRMMVDGDLNFVAVVGSGANNPTR